MAIKVHGSFAVHPGKWLRAEIIEPHGLKVTQAAERLGVTRQAMSNLLNGHSALSADMALRFEAVFGIKADTMLRMQLAYDLEDARQHGDYHGLARIAA